MRQSDAERSAWRLLQLFAKIAGSSGSLNVRGEIGGQDLLNQVLADISVLQALGIPITVLGHDEDAGVLHYEFPLVTEQSAILDGLLTLITLYSIFSSPSGKGTSRESALLSRLGLKDSPEHVLMVQLTADGIIEEQPTTQRRKTNLAPDQMAALIRLAVPDGASLGEAEEAAGTLIDRSCEAAPPTQDRALLMALGLVSLRMIQSEIVRDDLEALAARARELGGSWSDIARAAGITPQAAQRRWDPIARRKHAEYRRHRSSVRPNAD